MECPTLLSPGGRRSISDEPVVDVSAEGARLYVGLEVERGLSRSGHQVRAYDVITSFWHPLHQAPAFGLSEETCRVEVADRDELEDARPGARVYNRARTTRLT